MAERKNNNILYIGIVMVVVIVAVVIGVVLMNRGNGGNEGSSTGETSQNSGDENGLSASELNNVDVSIEYGDYDAMYDLSKSIQNGEMVGKVVKIEGDVSHPMSTYSVVQRNAADNSSIGTQFVIEGDADYPEDGEHIVITGKVVENGALYYVIKTLPEYVEEIDESDDGDDVDVIEDID